MSKFKLLCQLKAISEFAYDIHYSAKGKNFYSDHIFSERLADVDVQDDFIETMYLGESEDAPSSADINVQVAKITPLIEEDTMQNFKALREMIVDALMMIEKYDYKTIAEEDLLGSVAHILQRNNGLLFRQLRYDTKENASDEDIKSWITVHGNHIPIMKGQSKAEAIKGFIEKNKTESSQKKTEDKESKEKYRKSLYDNLSEKSKAIVDRAHKYEPSITKDITEEAKKQGVENIGIDYRKKSIDRAIEKAEEDVKEGKWKSLEESMDNMFDLVRYTQSSTVDNLVDTATKTLKNLKSKGYQIQKVKNFYLDKTNPYSGVNVQMISPKGVKLELQFNTPKNAVVKEKMHKIYEKQRVPNISKQDYDKYEAQMWKLAPQYETPKNIEKLIKENIDN